MIVVCPVCKTEIEDKKAGGAGEQDGENYCFCCKACKKQFDEDPNQYVDKK
ncbi:MAG: YHS domain-containing protein [Dehalococcoidia bacterium]|nr:YHS domain-containing protein [Dehalococcoidia bacterium]